jgi:hypothetical protein
VDVTGVLTIADADAGAALNIKSRGAPPLQ